MKVRNGFVSNSSSSSFILKFGKLPTSVEETKVMLYGDNPPILTNFWDDAISTQKAAEVLFRDFQNPDTMNINEMISAVREEIDSFNEYNYIEGFSFVEGTEFADKFDKLYVKVKEFDRSSDKYKGNWDWKTHYDKLDKMSILMLDLIEKAIRVKYNENDIFCKMEYSDGDGQIFSYIEHSGVLDPFTIQRFSHH